ncbi:MAG: hypothetical protein P8Z30_15380 [Acidobacteriota bacterium]|jgi:hypothetical protein
MKKLLLGVLLLLFMASVAGAVQTRLIVRARARDAKFIGSTMGGALVVVRNSETGEVMDKGFTVGGTGNTSTIMVQPQHRGVPYAGSSAAKFEATVDIDEPTLVTIEVSAPYAQRQSLEKTSTQLWLIPGKDVLGDGIIMEVPGFSVDVLAPQAHEMIRLSGGRLSVPIRANVMMMCGCPVTPGGLWDANRYEVAAIVKHNGAVSETIPLTYAGKTSTFEGNLVVTRAGVYEVTVYSFDPATGNAGVDKTTFMVR